MISTSEVFCVLAFIDVPRQKILTRVANYRCQLRGLESGIYASRAVPLQTDLFGNLRDDRGWPTLPASIVTGAAPPLRLRSGQALRGFRWVGIGIPWSTYAPAGIFDLGSQDPPQAGCAFPK